MNAMSALNYRDFWNGIHADIAVGERLNFPATDRHADAIATSADCIGARQRQFLVGRHCAREALHALGHRVADIPRGSNREPMWPAGVVGSISHTDDYCVAVVARRQHLASVGVDAERRRPLSNRVIAMICDADELTQMSRQPETSRTSFALVVFSAKESLFKCLSQLGRPGPMGFRDATLRIDWSNQQLSVQRLAVSETAVQCSSLHGRFSISASHVLTYIAATVTAITRISASESASNPFCEETKHEKVAV